MSTFIGTISPVDFRTYRALYGRTVQANGSEDIAFQRQLQKASRSPYTAVDKSHKPYKYRLSELVSLSSLTEKVINDMLNIYFHGNKSDFLEACVETIKNKEKPLSPITESYIKSIRANRREAHLRFTKAEFALIYYLKDQARFSNDLKTEIHKNSLSGNCGKASTITKDYIQGTITRLANYGLLKTSGDPNNPLCELSEKALYNDASKAIIEDLGQMYFGSTEEFINSIIKTFAYGEHIDYYDYLDNLNKLSQTLHSLAA